MTQAVMVMAEVISISKLDPNVYLVTFFAPDIVRMALPGQFVHIRIRDNLDPLLRRPFSIHWLDQDKGTLQVLFQIKGKGTLQLAGSPPGEKHSLLGPLGRGFSIAQAENVLLIGGGLGVAPLLYLTESLIKMGIRVNVLLGAQTRSNFLRVDAFRKLGASVEVWTEDGSQGERGLVTESLPRLLSERRIERIYACGPEAMLRRVAQAAGAYSVSAEVSLEARMACGFGACNGCVVSTSAGYKKVCTDGPVFNAELLLQR